MYELHRQIMHLRTGAHSDDLDQTAHSHSLIRIVPVRSLESKETKYLHADAQPDVSLRWTHMTEGMFCHVDAHM